MTKKILIRYNSFLAFLISSLGIMSSCEEPEHLEPGPTPMYGTQPSAIIKDFSKITIEPIVASPIEIPKR